MLLNLKMKLQHGRDILTAKERSKKHCSLPVNDAVTLTFSSSTPPGTSSILSSVFKNNNNPSKKKSPIQIMDDPSFAEAFFEYEEEEEAFYDDDNLDEGSEFDDEIHENMVNYLLEEDENSEQSRSRGHSRTNSSGSHPGHVRTTSTSSGVSDHSTKPLNSFQLKKRRMSQLLEAQQANASMMDAMIDTNNNSNTQRTHSDTNSPNARTPSPGELLDVDSQDSMKRKTSLPDIKVLSSPTKPAASSETLEEKEMIHKSPNLEEDLNCSAAKRKRSKSTTANNSFNKDYRYSSLNPQSNQPNLQQCVDARLSPTYADFGHGAASESFVDYYNTSPRNATRDSPSPSASLSSKSSSKSNGVVLTLQEEASKICELFGYPSSITKSPESVLNCMVFLEGVKAKIKEEIKRVCELLELNAYKVLRYKEEAEDDVENNQETRDHIMALFEKFLKKFPAERKYIQAYVQEILKNYDTIFGTKTDHRQMLKNMFSVVKFLKDKTRILRKVSGTRKLKGSS